MKTPYGPSRFRGIRIHDVAAQAIGAKTLDQQNDQAKENQELTDPTTGGLDIQNRLKRFGGPNAQ